MDISFLNTPASTLAKIIKKAPKLQQNKSLLLECLSKFTQHHPAIAYIAKTLIHNHQKTFSSEDLTKIFTSHVSRPTKLRLFFMLNAKNQAKTLAGSTDEFKKSIEAASALYVAELQIAQGILYEKSKTDSSVNVLA